MITYCVSFNLHSFGLFTIAATHVCFYRSVNMGLFFSALVGAFKAFPFVKIHMVIVRA